MTQPRPHRAPRYRVVVYELHDDNQTKTIDATTSGFIAAAATIHNGEMDITLADGGTHDLQQHIALFINSQYRVRPTKPDAGGSPLADPTR